MDSKPYELIVDLIEELKKVPNLDVFKTFNNSKMDMANLAMNKMLAITLKWVFTVTKIVRLLDLIQLGALDLSSESLTPALFAASHIDKEINEKNKMLSKFEQQIGVDKVTAYREG